MLLPVFHDLIKPQWRLVLESLKLQGGLPISELSKRTGASYMAVKTHCEELLKAGYVLRTRVPRAEVGRPEIFYSLAPSADRLFPEAGATFTLELLEAMKPMFGENAPEKLLFQHFENRREQWMRELAKTSDTAERLRRLAELRQRHAVVWIQVRGVGDVELLRRLGEMFDLHRLALADVANVQQRAKVEDYGAHEFVVARQVSPAPDQDTEQFAMFVGKGFVLSFQERAEDCFEMVRRRLLDAQGLMRQRGSDYLAYALLDSVVDS
ncbi:MAG: winged helix-turn-helix transcriptional regulator, partial [Verrucomicrobiae bacterium]|nr:winged helix-turn-helix transcriptional regulator [Verrucomicrobiae bacterium]